MERPVDKAERERFLLRYFYSLLPYWRKRDDGGVNLCVHEHEDEWVFCNSEFGVGVVACIERDSDDDRQGFSVQVTTDDYVQNDTGFIFATMDDAKRALLVELPSMGDEKIHKDAEYAHETLARELPGWLHILIAGCSTKEEQVADLEARSWAFDAGFEDVERWDSDPNENEAELLAEEPL